MIKRFFDFSAALLGLIILSPFLLLLCIIIRISTPGPCIFKQIRAGRYGKPFTIFKYRTMVLEHGGNTISVRGEERITPIGAILRKYKIDELPELWNVIRGDMSFVGPRPDMPEYIEKLVGEERKILELRPGITGTASLKYSNEEELLASMPDPRKFNDEVIWPDKKRINLDYYYKRNFLGDIGIILRTVFGKKGSSDN